MCRIMNKMLIIIGCTIALGVFALQKHWIIVRNPLYTKSISSKLNSATVVKKKVKLYYWHHGMWNHEEVQVVWPCDPADALCCLLNKWLVLMADERLIDRICLVESAVITSGQTAYVSFDYSPLAPNSSTGDKYLIIESALKTVRESGLPIQAIHFLNRHQNFDDPHLDFSFAWPICGFQT